MLKAFSKTYEPISLAMEKIHEFGVYNQRILQDWLDNNTSLSSQDETSLTAIFDDIKTIANTNIKDVKKFIESLKGKTIKQSEWEHNFERCAWSKIIPSLRGAEFADLPILSEDRKRIIMTNVKVRDKYARISDALVARWQYLGILDNNSCLTQKIDFSTSFLSVESVFQNWKEEIDLLIGWAGCYVIPKLPLTF